MQIKSEYEVSEEYVDIAQNLLKKYPNEFTDLDLSKIRPVLIVNKDRTERNPNMWQIKGVTLPIAMDCPYTHYVIVHATDWENLEKKHRYLLVAETLCAISAEDPDEGKVKPFDMKGYALMLRTFGPDFMVKDDVPDILKDKVNWVSI